MIILCVLLNTLLLLLLGALLAVIVISAFEAICQFIGYLCYTFGSRTPGVLMGIFLSFVIGTIIAIQGIHLFDPTTWSVK